MSMSEFDGPGTENDLISFPGQEKGLPGDFSAEDMAFALELEGLFSVQDEYIPPYFVQTLLEPENPRFQAVEQGFEQKTYARVFRQLNLPRRLFCTPHSSARSVRGVFSLKHSLKVLVAACLICMLATMIITSNSFAAGLAILLSGAHSGVIQVPGYPKGLSAPRPQATQSAVEQEVRQISLLRVQQQLTFSMYSPVALPANYSLTGLSLFDGVDQRWADGPVVEMDYDYLLPGVKPHGTGRIAIREFKPTGKVFQVVQSGAAHQIEMHNDGAGQVAVYIDGQWGQTTKVSQAWVFGTRSELIYEHDGVVFWIVGDQQDGINDSMLQTIASSMQPFNVNRAAHMASHIDALVTYEDSTWLFAGYVVYWNSPDGASGSVVGLPTLPFSPSLHSGQRSSP